jgi:hypothetical protein
MGVYSWGSRLGQLNHLKAKEKGRSGFGMLKKRGSIHLQQLQFGVGEGENM